MSNTKCPGCGNWAPIAQVLTVGRCADCYGSPVDVVPPSAKCPTCGHWKATGTEADPILQRLFLCDGCDLAMDVGHAIAVSNCRECTNAGCSHIVKDGACAIGRGCCDTNFHWRDKP